MIIGVERQGELVSLDVVPASVNRGGKSVGYLGIAPTSNPWPEEYKIELSYGPIDALFEGMYKTWDLVVLSFDMIAKLITTAQTREEAINKMRRALDEFVIEGIKTTIPFHRQLMDHPDYLAGNYTTKFMEDFEMDPKYLD